MSRNKKRNKIITIILLVLLVIAFTLDIVLGSVDIPIFEAVKILFGNSSTDQIWNTIILEFRIPKAITAMLAGSALSVCGLIMQTYFRNPLAEPYVLGISSGASFGVALVILTAGSFGLNLYFLGDFFSQLSITTAAVIGSALVLLLITFAAKKVSSNVTLLILGLMIGHIIGALESILKYFSAPENLQGYIIWGMGNFSNVLWKDLYFLVPIIFLGLAGSYILSKQLNLLLLGEHYALSMGANIKLLRFLLIIIGGVLAGIITAFCGPIAFIGIAVPQITRNLLHESDHRKLIPAVALVGSLLTLICDMIAQMPGGEQTLPINVVTSLVGAPVVIWIILQQRKIKHTFAMD
ncbi:MAG: iron ABC transporter permease [Ignavibacteriaceae bacterium]|jgi:iron complex transport system permease protein|nr:iron ABC transporter permease [Ignavibacteriaceae bacterium]